jgi:hypothetical protein
VLTKAYLAARVAATVLLAVRAVRARPVKVLQAVLAQIQRMQ